MSKISKFSWIVYILLCEDGTLYTGITNDIKKRLQAHLKGKGARYTKSHIPKEIVYQESFVNRSHASKRESQIKALKKNQKQELINEHRHTISKSY